MSNMTPTLRDLSDLELALYQRVIALSGIIEAKREQLDASDIGASYLQVHCEYVRLATGAASATTRLEALKRLVFLSWYMFAEPDIYSGLSYLDEDVIKDSYTLLDTYLGDTPRLDPELYWMLHSYASWWNDGLLSDITGLPLPALTSFIAATESELYLVPEHQLSTGIMDHRGQMGLYWRSRQVEVTDYHLPGQ